MILAISGPQGGGKDTIGEGLAEIFEADVDRFARNLYAMCATVDPVFHPKMAHADKDDWVLGRPELGTRRAFLEKLGTEFGRDMIHPNLWTLLTLERGTLLPRILVDCRFDSEAEAVREIGGLVIHLRPDWTSFGRRHASDFPIAVRPGDIVMKLTEGNYEADLERLASMVADNYKADAR